MFWVSCALCIFDISFFLFFLCLIVYFSFVSLALELVVFLEFIFVFMYYYCFFYTYFLIQFFFFFVVMHIFAPCFSWCVLSVYLLLLHLFHLSLSGWNSVHNAHNETYVLIILKCVRVWLYFNLFFYFGLFKSAFCPRGLHFFFIINDTALVVLAAFLV